MRIGRGLGRRPSLWPARAIGTRFGAIAVSMMVVAGCAEDDRIPRPGLGDASAPEADAGPAGPEACIPDEGVCDGLVHSYCDIDGLTRLGRRTCDEFCLPSRGCVECEPGARRCAGDIAEACGPDGSWYPIRDCSVFGESCLEPSAVCSGPCGEQLRQRSYIGCDYAATPLANPHLDMSSFEFRVAVSNVDDEAAEVRIRRGGQTVHSEVVGPGEVSEILLPWIDVDLGASSARAGPGRRAHSISTVVSDAVYHITSSRPVVVYQFNPLEYEKDGNFSYTNDASLLLPTYLLADRYIGVGYVPLSTYNVVFFTLLVINYPSYVAVANAAGVPVTVHVLARSRLAPDGKGRFSAKRPGDRFDVEIEAGEVLYLTGSAPPGCMESTAESSLLGEFPVCNEVEYDVTGLEISASGPVAVFGGHTCANVPYNLRACDHLEEQLPPVSTWGTSFVGAPMSQTSRPPRGLVRVVAGTDGTEVHVAPEELGVAPFTLEAGQYRDFYIDGPFALEASEPVFVAQYILAADYSSPPSETGDPALTFLPPTDQFRSEYQFIAPSSYRAEDGGQSYVLVIRPRNAPILFDGEPFEATWRPVDRWQVGIAPVEGGAHTLRAEDGRTEFGVLSYGVGAYTSYAYPAGLDLDTIE